MNYHNLKIHIQKIADVNYSAAVLGWDQEVYMPSEGAEARGRQLATLAGIAHDLFVSEVTRNLLLACKNDNSLNENEKLNVQLLEEDLRLKEKYSTAFVEELSVCTSKCFNAWQEAKAKNDFSLFAPYLSQMVILKRKEAALLGFEKSPYDALLNLYEKKCTSEQLDKLFSEVRKELVPFVKNLSTKKQVNNAFFFQQFDENTQWNFGLEILRKLGYNLSAGRQDKSSHPFTTNFNSKDVRITTRVDEKDFSEMMWSTIHEAGHALYEQGLPYSEYGMPLGEYLSLGIHESQSRFWENNVGRGKLFWKYFYPTLQNQFPQQLGSINLDQFYCGMNKVEPSLIRTSADELTYHFHIMIRYELEKDLIEGKLEVEQLPQAWNKKYKEYLDLDVPNDQSGVLQDVHWSHGSFGYFPTYSIGSFYAAQFYFAAEKQIQSLNDQIEQGEFSHLLHWLRTQVHAHGRKFTADELCKKITGETLQFKYFMDYARRKYSLIYP